MRTDIHPALASLPEVREADSILRKCVHCGFCNATCPTYQLLGDELDGPRGRIYLIKNLLEHNAVTDSSLQHLDRCLTCRACETTCPSGVEYGRLIDIGRGVIGGSIGGGVNGSVPGNLTGKPSRPWGYRTLSFLVRLTVPRPWLFRPLLWAGQWLRLLLALNISPLKALDTNPLKALDTNPLKALDTNPLKALNKSIKTPPRQTGAVMVQRPPHEVPPADTRVLLLGGCVQTAATPGVNEAITRILQCVGKSVEIADMGCCGALDYHLSARETGMARMRTLIEKLYRRIEDVDVILSSATGCGVTIMEYEQILAADTQVKDKLRRVLEKFQDVSALVVDCLPQLISVLDIQDGQNAGTDPLRVAVHTPCSMQHGMKLVGRIEDILGRAGFRLLSHKDGHLCCGSAGAYSILQPALSQQLLQNKLDNLEEEGPDVIVTANVGCQLHLQSGASVPVMHWAELIAAHLGKL